MNKSTTPKNKKKERDLKESHWHRIIGCQDSNQQNEPFGSSVFFPEMKSLGFVVEVSV